MIAQTLKLMIEAYADRTLSENRLLGLARAGRLTPDTLAAYLFNVRYLIRHTPPYLERARVSAEARGWTNLATYYARKARDEHGHERWADADLARVRAKLGVLPPVCPAEAMVELVGYLRELIDAHPHRYLAYILFAEYFTVLAGPSWLAALERSCGVPASFLTSIGNHMELDKLHVAEGVAEIDALLPDPRELAALEETLRRSFEYFERFCVELGRDQH
jgi:hypothetical protein